MKKTEWFVTPRSRVQFNCRTLSDNGATIQVGFEVLIGCFETSVCTSRPGVTFLRTWIFMDIGVLMRWQSKKKRELSLKYVETQLGPECRGTGCWNSGRDKSAQKNWSNTRILFYLTACSTTSVSPAWRQVAQRCIFFRLSVSWGPRVLVQSILLNTMF
jgi:hypothetical protein